MSKSKKKRITEIERVIANDPIEQKSLEITYPPKFQINQIKTKTKKQADYLKLLQTNDIVFAIGAAGCGKTHLATAYAFQLLQAGTIDKIILMRPAIVACDEKIGFIPGEINEKMQPFLQPIYSILKKCSNSTKLVQQLVEQGRLEVIPLAYARGITFENAFVILDEAQNCNFAKLEMFLTRLGENSKLVLCGDITQTDIKDSALEPISDLLSETTGISTVWFDENDSVRHPLVKTIINILKDQK